MTEMTRYAPGEFCWVELGTSDWKAAVRFYTSLFGWTTNEMPMGPDQPPYVMLQKNGKDVGALTENKKAPPNWLTYIAVANADEAAKKARSLGATLMSDPFDVMDAGRMTMLQDPEGAWFAIWQANKSIGAGVIGEPNSLCWNELSTNDPEKARKFYSALFGWKTKISPQYTELLVGGVARGGMMPMNEQMKGVPANWMPYFAVSDCDASTSKAASLGGKVCVGPMDIPDAGRFSVLADPQGAMFAVIKLMMQS